MHGRRPAWKAAHRRTPPIGRTEGGAKSDPITNPTLREVAAPEHKMPSQIDRADAREAQPLHPRIFTRNLADIVGAGHPSLIYQRPRSWRDTLDCEVMRRRWDDWTARLAPADHVFHAIPDGWEESWCAVLDWYRWSYLRTVHRQDEREPNMWPFDSLSRADRDRVAKGAHTLWFERWKRMQGRPWAIVCDAREKAFCCHQIDFYRWRAGKPVVYETPNYTAELLEAAWAKPKRRRAA
jgi:hypothetical protein